MLSNKLCDILNKVKDRNKKASTHTHVDIYVQRAGSHH